MNDCIVRADHYPNGLIIPLGFTDKRGKSIYIDRVIDIQRDSSRRIIYCCKVKEKIIHLIYNNSKWVIEE